MAGETEAKLRDEILDSHRTRLDLSKWKMIMVAAIGAGALGVGGEKTGGGIPVLLALLPPVCVFVDMLCYHAEVRILVIATFLRTEESSDRVSKKYEEFCSEKRDVFSAETKALWAITAVVSGVVAAIGILVLGHMMAPLAFGIGATGNGQASIPAWHGVLLIVSAIASGLVTFDLHRKHNRTRAKIEQPADRGATRAP